MSQMPLMPQIPQILVGLAALTSGAITMMAIDISQNREHVRAETVDLNNTIDALELINQGKPVSERTMELSKLIHPSNNSDKLETWRNKKLAEKQAWLRKPFYEQLGRPPIASFSELFSELSDD